MHEFAIAQDIMTSLNKNLQENFTRISKVNIEVGTFSGIVSDSLSFGLEALFKEQSVENVKIDIKNNNASALCECGNEYVVNNIFDLCPECESAVREMPEGMEITVTSVELREK